MNDSYCLSYFVFYLNWRGEQREEFYWVEEKLWCNGVLLYVVAFSSHIMGAPLGRYPKEMQSGCYYDNVILHPPAFGQKACSEKVIDRTLTGF